MHRITLCAIAAFASTALGQLTPPPGPVEPTMKTLDEVEPSTPLSQDTTPGDADSLFRITHSGHYHLTGNVNTVNLHAIEIHAPRVTLDLRGFTINVSGQYAAIVGTGQSGSITVRRGEIISNSIAVGIDLGNGTNGVVEDVRFHHASPAVNMGDHGTVRRCMVRLARSGIVVGDNSVVESCFAEAAPGESDDGITTGASCIVRDCTVSGFNRFGVTAGQGTRVIDCTARACDFSGFQGAASSSFNGCTSVNNAGHGFFFMTGVRARDCSADNNGQNGFNVYQACVLNDCTATFNFKNGIETVGSMNRITGNTLFNNGQHGIHVPTDRNVIALNHAGGHGHAVNNIWIILYDDNYFGGIIDLNDAMSLPHGNFTNND